jgi:H+-transporting ATPase
LTRLLVPGDIVLLVGGCAIPADVEWIEGDVLSIDTAALTGEPLPRKYPSEQYGNTILCGCTVRAGEAYCRVSATGVNTEIGSSSAEIMKDKATAKVSVFEERVLFAVKIIIMISLFDVLVIFFVQGIGREEFEHDIKELLLTCLSIIIAAVPVALPLVLQVTMALGAGKMARDFNAVVTSLPALQDISSMSVLCSDKTGTLTTAKITISAESVWVAEGFTDEQLALYGALSSNRDKKEDPIDRSVINHFDALMGKNGLAMCAEYSKIRLVGFNPIYKRVVAEFSHPTAGRITIAKGLPAKVLDTADGGVDDAGDQWKVENLEELYPRVCEIDMNFSKAGYKTLGVAVKFGDGPFRFVGILPMLDPPRHDSSQTIKLLQVAGVNVKMITGDHLNIAKETARLIGMGTNIHPGEATRDASETGHELIYNADGFAQVLPRDKREVVLVLKNVYGQVTGMTGDGVNDAPALSAAQCGIAVDDATDAAKNAAAIILTSPGLSAIYSAVVESRRIFRKLKAYVIYRFAATIQIVIVLSLVIFVSNCPINSLFVILLALFNDLTMLPIAYDRQQASATPENPEVGKMLLLSLLLGGLETLFSMVFAYGAGPSGLFHADYQMDTCDKKMQAAVWLQMSIAAELLIFSARAPSFIFNSILPSGALFTSVIFGCILTTVLAGVFKYFGRLPVTDMLLIWAYDIICLIIIDLCKVMYLRAFNESMETLPDVDMNAPHPAEVSRATGVTMDRPMSKSGQVVDVLMHMHYDDDGEKSMSKVDASQRRMEDWAAGRSQALRSKQDITQMLAEESNDFHGSSMAHYRENSKKRPASSRARASSTDAVAVPKNQSYGLTPSTIYGRDLLSTSYSLRPNTPANATQYKQRVATSYRR